MQQAKFWRQPGVGADDAYVPIGYGFLYLVAVIA
jgi:hypothetical protein